jgi:membrane-bound lytic murein transglycosylase D
LFFANNISNNKNWPKVIGVFAICTSLVTISNGSPSNSQAFVKKINLRKQARQELRVRRLPVESIRDPFAFSTQESSFSTSQDEGSSPVFDLPVTYNDAVRKWILYFQTTGKKSFTRWLELSGKHVPAIQRQLNDAQLPLDLAYLAMIESGFSPFAISTANAVGPWQFIESTASRYGLTTKWWLDERKDFTKSTAAAIRYIKDLYDKFQSWYLVLASYNMGENGVERLIKKYRTNDFWKLAKQNVLPAETKEYVPKLMAAMLIAKAPGLYGFRDLNLETPSRYEYFWAPGGTDLRDIADHLDVTRDYLRLLNPELVKSMVPRSIRSHKIRIPAGSKAAVSQYLNSNGQFVAVD